MRYILAIFAAKLILFIGKILKKNTTAKPGQIATKICPDILKNLSKRIDCKIIVTCGTNGKTTTNNLIFSTLSNMGYNVLCNNLGANMTSGIVTSILDFGSLFGKIKADYLCLEIDEAYAEIIFKQIKPDIMIITNLFRDQLDRYGEIDITSNKLKAAIAQIPYATLILNGDDPLTANLGSNHRDVKYFGVPVLTLPQKEEVREGRFCAKCGMELKYNFYHYLQLGDYYCPSCGNSRPPLDYTAENVNVGIQTNFDIEGQHITMNQKGFYNIYNVLAAYSIIKVLGIQKNDFGKYLSGFKPQIGRMEQFDFNKPVIFNLAKNPAGFNQTIDTVIQDPRKKDIIIVINDKVNDGHDVSWLWDVAFDKLNDNNTLTCCGIRLYDLALRFKYEDIDVTSTTRDVEFAIRQALKTDSEVCYVLVNYTALFDTNEILKKLKKETER